MPQFWKVVWNKRHALGTRMSEADARAMAERWQGSRYHAGLLKHGDKGDWIEVIRDTESEKEFDRMYDDLKRGKPQTLHMIGG